MGMGNWMERVCMVVWLILIVHPLRCIHANEEGDALNTFKKSLTDPKNVLQSWDATLVTPCTWFHLTCSNDNRVTRVDLGSANLTGVLVPELGQLTKLQYFELYDNNISGTIPSELGNLTELLSLDLYKNNIDGPIPDTLGKLSKLRYLRLNNNRLTGNIPITLTGTTTLEIVDLSNNDLSGVIPTTGSFSQFTPISFSNNSKLIFPPGH